MSFVSYSFVAFILLCLLLYYILPQKFRWIVLLLSSYTFYFLACNKYILYIMLTTVTTYFAGLLISNNLNKQKEYLKEHKQDLSKEEKKAYKSKMKKQQKTILVLCLLLNFGILAFIKYANFVIANINWFRLTAFQNTNYFNFYHLILPLGISFYTFQSMGYLIDIYYGKQEGERHFGKISLFISFFPQIIQGPISRYDQIGNQLFEGHKFNWDNIIYGFYQIMWGLFKKLVIADRVAVYVGNTVTSYKDLGGSYILLAIFFYSMQIYGDFSGGIDITIGVARMFGIEMPANFERPFFSKSVAEYWRRWHITLGTWFKDYIFYPLSIAKWTIHFGKWIRNHINDTLGKKVPIYISMFIVWFTTGLWHGAEWRYIVWGLLNFVILCISTELEPWYKIVNERLPFRQGGTIQKAFRIVRTFWIMAFLRVFDIASGGVKEALSIMRGVFHNFFSINLATIESLGLPLQELEVAVVACFIVFTISMLQRKGSIRKRIMNTKLPVRWAIMTALVLGVVIYGSYGMGYDARSFIYLQF